jgi:hypothetical protein
MAPIMWCGTILFMAALGLSVLSARAEEDDWDINEAPHFYQQRIPSDRITRMKGALESGQVALDVSSEKAFLVSLLKHLEVPLSSQLLVFSTTSLQLSRISPSSPRAIYFSDEVYVGYVPGGRIEVVALDPELGGIFYIFDIPSTQKPIRLERSDRCMNCHAGSETGYVPGLALKSVMPGPSGGSLTAYRIDLTGHDIPLSERLGRMACHGAGKLHKPPRQSDWSAGCGSRANGPQSAGRALLVGSLPGGYQRSAGPFDPRAPGGICESRAGRLVSSEDLASCWAGPVVA